MVAILGANSVSGGDLITNSLRFNDGDSSKLTFTPGGAGDRDTFTFSFWVKRGVLGTGQRIFSAGTSIGTNNNNVSSLLFESDDTLKFFGEVGGSVSFTLQTNRLFRDPSAWYHIVVAVDTEDGTAANRIKLYVNGVQESSFSTATYMSQNTDTFFNAANLHNISYAGGGGFVDGYLAEFHHIDGTQVAPTDFGEFDDNGVWIPKEYEGSYGTNGFYLQFKETGTGTDASGIGADTSGNANHFAPTNLAAIDVTTDTPMNNFCTLNPAGGANSSSQWTFSEGNTQIQQNDNGNWRATGSTMAVANGKWYWEIEFDAGTMSEIFVGVHDSDVSLEGTNRWVAGSTLFYNHEGGEIRQDGTNTTADYGVLTAGDILGVALNMDDKQISFYDNGSAIVSNFALSSSITGFAMPTFLSDASNIVYKVNFGNPPFAISSGNADANGYGNFEYAVPSGYYSLCTKNLAEFG